MAEVQQLVEALGEHLSRPVEVDDQQLRLVAHSAHGQDVDGVRAASILHRRAPDAVARWVVQNGLNRSTTPVRTAPVEELGMSARICMALRAHGQLLGYLWIIEREQPLDDAETQEVARVAELLARALDHERSAADQLRHHHDALLDTLLRADVEGAARAADDLLGEGALSARRPAVVLCAGSGAIAQAGAQSRSDDLEGVFEELRHRLPIGVSRWVPLHGRAVMVVTGEPAAEGCSGLRQHLHGILGQDQTSPESDRIVVGIGDTVDDLAEAGRSYRHARAALDVARRVPEMGSCLEWAGLGIYQLLSRLPISEPDAAELLHPALRDLITSGRHGELIQTLEVFLDLGGDARAASEQLHLHRTSVYQRLRRIEALTGMSLHDGQARLTLHASIKLARLIGVYAG